MSKVSERAAAKAYYVSKRVQIPAYTDRWMMGDRYGEVIGAQLGEPLVLRVKLDKSGHVGRFIAVNCEIID